MISPNVDEQLKFALALTFKATNNESKYEALIRGPRLSRGLGVTFLSVKCDSQLVVIQVKGEYKAKGENK